ncbi:spore germination protein GerPC [Litchfieldia alkalitelluris]|uniref:spore germination protein GerPC n=1 Tax=Litchfieldia alkalitelluris TaxID=304268 RepID=UPI0009962C63|nr:spore germination protein GerPC [Litchfieldia alkalitelluris]
MYGSYYEIIAYLNDLHKYVEFQNKRIEALEQQIKQFQRSIIELQQKPSTTIERIEYKFDQLKVETLEGTLNIGLNPMDGETIEDFSVAQGKMNVPDIRKSNPGEHVHPVVDSIQSEITNYLDNDCIEFIKKLEQDTNHPLEDSYREFIIDDISHQIPDRIKVYIQQQQGLLNSNERLQEIKENTIKKVIIDIQNSISSFFTNIPNEMKGG